MLTRDTIQGFLEKLQHDYATAKEKATEAQAAVASHAGALQAVMAILELWDDEKNLMVDPEKPGRPALVADPSPITPQAPPKG